MTAPSPQLLRTHARRAGTLLVPSVVPLAALLVVLLLEPGLAEPRGELLVLNALLVTLVIVALWAVTARVLLATLLACCAYGLLHAANALKYAQLRRMLEPADLALLAQVATMPGLFANYLAANLGWLLVGVAAVVIAALLWWKEPKWLPRLAVRGPALFLVAVLLGSLLGAPQVWSGVLHDQRLGGFELWVPDRSLPRTGLALGLVRLAWERDAASPGVSDADRDALAAFLDAHPPATTAALAQEPMPDIVVVQSEALFDPGRIAGIDSAQWIPEFRRLQSRGIHGDLAVPAYGGGTIRTEFEVLTGYPLAAFPGVAWPYYALADAALPALPAQLRALGYRTLVVHPYDRRFWKRDAVMPRLGFSEALFEPDGHFRDAARRGPFVSDDAAYEATLDMLAGQRPQFAFVITMENHSPWRHRSAIAKPHRDAVRVPPQLAEDARKELQTYLLHVRDGDAALGRFARSLLARERPTLLLVYGDHMPALDHAYPELSFRDGRAAWQQPVPYLLVGNRPMQVRRQDLPAHALPMLVLEAAGLPASRYLSASAALRARRAGCTTAAECAHFASLELVAARLDHRGEWPGGPP